VSREFVCPFCSRPVSPNAVGTYRKTSGWTARRDGGRGGVRLAKYADEWAHSHCVESAAQGRLNQGALL
jgi:hypothetical protein